jgi:DNA repair protein RecO (recombination protein O)
MAIIKTEAFVFKSFRFGETSLICRLLTRDRGVVPVIAKGARRPKSRLGAALGPFRRLGVTYYDKPGREIQTLVDVELLVDHPGVAGSLERLEAAGTWFRFLRALLPEGAPADTLYALATTALVRLETSSDSDVGRWEAYHRAAVAGMLGLGPAIDACAGCGRELPDGGRLAFSVEEGGVLCGACVAHRPGSETLAPAAYAILQLYHHPDYSLVAGLEDDPDVEREVRRLIRRFVAYHADLGSSAADVRGAR